MKRFLCAILSFTVIFGITSVFPLALDFQSAQQTDVESGTFRFAIEVAGKGYTHNKTATYYYSDSYFDGSAKEYNSHLATMSMCLAVSAFSIIDNAENPDYSSQSDNAVALFEDIGFVDVTPNADMYRQPTDETMGAVIGRKALSDSEGEYTLVALALRGGAYGSEWAENAEVGYESDYDGNHKGFYEARDRILAFLTDYVADLSGRVKLWTVGYSRAGAVAGLVSAWVTDNASSLENKKITVAQNDVFTYTFEAPRATARKNTVGKDYSNIHNIIGANDVVPKLAMVGNADNGWDFVRVGDENVYNASALSDRTTDALYEQRTSLAKRFLASLKPAALAAQDSISDGSGRWDGMPVWEAVNYVCDTLASSITRRDYVRRVQPFAYRLLNQLYADAQSLNRLTDAAQKLISDSSNLLEMLPMSADTDLTGGVAELILENTQTIKSVACIILEDILREAEFNYDKGELVAAVQTIVDIIAKEGEDFINLLITLATQKNGGIFIYHYPEVPLSYLMAQDTYYGGVDGPAPSPITRKLTVKDADVLVKNSVGTVVFSSSIAVPYASSVIIQKPVIPFSSSLKSTVSDGEITLYLPSNESYTVELSTGVRSEYSISDCSVSDGGALRRVVYSDVPSESVLYAEIPAISEGRLVRYTLSDSLGAQLLGEDTAREQMKAVTLDADCDGVVLSGGGEYLPGESASVCAGDSACYKFSGWYLDGTLVCTERDYTFTVEESTHLTAHFDQTHTASEWIVDAEAQVGEQGSEHTECTVCGLKLDERKIPYVPSPSEPSDPQENNLPIVIVISAALVAAVTLAVVLLKLKKKKGAHSAPSEK